MIYPNGISKRSYSNDGAWGSATYLGRLQAIERDALLALGRPAVHPESEHLMVEGDQSRFVLVLHDGAVKVVVYDTSGREHVLGLRGRGDLLGELAFLDARPRSASVVALSQITATKIAAESFSRFLEQYPRAGVELARYVAARLRDADRSRVEITTDHVTLRVARLLRDLVVESQTASPQRDASIPLTQIQLAQLAHGAEVTVNRVLRDFRARDLVRTGYGSIEVACLDCLDRYVTLLAADQKERAKAIRGCGGRDSHSAR